MDQSRTLPDGLHSSGYDREAEYFYRQNQELIAQNRRTLDAGRAQQAAEKGGEGFWMRCPSCGGHLTEKETMGLKGDVCATCGGVFLRREELSQLTASHDDHSFKEAIGRLLTDAFKPLPSGISQFPV